MANRNNANGRNNSGRRNSIVTSSDRIICTETQIQLSDEKLKGMFAKVYEIARKDANRFRLHNHFGVFLSLGSTMLLSLLTTDFKKFSFIKDGALEKWGWRICVGSLLLGVILAIVNVTVRHNNENEERDKAISNILNDITTVDTAESQATTE